MPIEWKEDRHAPSYCERARVGVYELAVLVNSMEDVVRGLPIIQWLIYEHPWAVLTPIEKGAADNFEAAKQAAEEALRKLQVR